LEANDSKQMILQVGSALKRIRKEKQISLEELSELTGVSKLTLGNIERGETNPTVGILMKISNGLSIPFMSLFTSTHEVNLYRAGEGFRIANDQKNWVIESFYKSPSNDFEMCRAYLQPNSFYQSELHHVNTVEIATVMEGNITIYVNEEPFSLNQYDSISFRGDHPHSYLNNTDTEVVLHITLKYGV